MTTPTTKPFFLSADDAANQALEYAIRWAAGAGDRTAAYGRKTTIAAELAALSTAKVTRNHIHRWLNPDPAKRVQTNLGMGMLLLHVVYVMAGEVKGDHPHPTIAVQLSLQKPKKTTK